MRSDMPKVLCEEPRCGPRGGYPRHLGRQALQRDPDSLPRTEGIRRPWTNTGQDRDYGEHLNPIFRWLEKQVNRPWRCVEGELMACLDMRSTVQKHVWDHVEMEVNRHPTGYDDRGHPTGSRSGAWLYVDQKGFLRKNGSRQFWRARRKETEQPSNVVRRISNELEYRHLHGSWFEVKLKAIEDAEQGRDMVTGGSDPEDALYPSQRRATFKRQLSKREMKKLKLPRQLDS